MSVNLRTRLFRRCGKTTRTVPCPEASRVLLRDTKDGTSREQVLLASNSYLDLANVPELKQAMANAVLEWGTGSGGARLTTGYMANVGTISALCGKGDYVFSDELNHASIIDGIRLSRSKCLVYKHNDMADLERAILEAKDAVAKSGAEFRGMVVTDAVFSMDGDLANLPELLRIAHGHDCLLMIDEAHATGVIGKTGRGLAEHYGCEHADVTVGTLSKAVAAEGGFVAVWKKNPVFSKPAAQFLKSLKEELEKSQNT